MMKRILFISALLAGSAILPAHAALVLSVTPSSQSVTLGNQATVDLVLSGLESVAPDEILAAYDVTFAFDPAILGYSSGTFLDLVDIPPAPDFSVVGEISWNSTSFEADATLQGSQGDSLTLATLVFDTSGTGTSAVSFTFTDLTGLNASPLTPTVLNGSVTVSNGVPVPATVVLMGLGVLGMTGARRGRAKA